MQTKSFCIISGIMLFFLSACENELKFDIKEHESTLVVEGWIDQNSGPQILLTLSAPYFSEIDSSSLRNFAVTTAKVSVFSSNSIEVLTLKPNSQYFPPLLYRGFDLKGETDTEYKLEIKYRGKTYTSSTRIPNLVKPDSVWFERNETDTAGIIWVKISDNPNEKNYYRLLTKVKNKDARFIPAFNSIFSDEQFNGKTLNIPVSKGNTSILDIENSRLFSVGDTIVLRFCSLEKAHYDFWNTIGTQAITSSNPYSVSNVDVPSNIEGGIGIWGGYAVSYDTIIAK